MPFWLKSATAASNVNDAAALHVTAAPRSLQPDRLPGRNQIVHFGADNQSSEAAENSAREQHSTDNSQPIHSSGLEAPGKSGANTRSHNPLDAAREYICTKIAPEACINSILLLGCD